MTAPMPDQDGPDAAARPLDAATLIIVDSTGGERRFLMGKRRMDVAFMPGKYVFPGGRVDQADKDAPSADDLAASETAKLMLDMKGHPSAVRARALALAAVRETFEEAGLVIGRSSMPPRTGEAGWLPFLATGYAPALSGLTYFARAITPPGRPRRFDTRFFCCDIAAVTHRVDVNDGELLGLDWFTADSARELDLPPITRVIIEDLGDRLQLGPLGPSGAAIPYYHQRFGTFKRDLLTLEGGADFA
jgi:8-oxo-dGTP pyrophosphatase MutT (NUDIX family)